jgi:hypothetical protein
MDSSMESRRSTVPLAALVLAALVLAPPTTHAQTPAGTVASLQGRADAQQGGQVARTLAVGTDVFVGDRLRTAEASRLKILMRDDSVVTLGPKSELVIDEQVVRADGATSRLSALVGAVRAVVTERYGTPGSSFETKTPTAVAGVRGTGFVVLVDDDGKRTRVIGLYDVTWVRSVTDPNGRHEVRVGPGQITEVVAGGLPTKPRALPPSDVEALVATTTIAPGTPEAEQRGGAASAPGSAAEGSGDAGDPATPAPPGSSAFQRPDGVIDQPIQNLGKQSQPPPPPPRK